MRRFLTILAPLLTSVGIYARRRPLHFPQKVPHSNLHRRSSQPRFDPRPRHFEVGPTHNLGVLTHYHDTPSYNDPSKCAGDGLYRSIHRPTIWTSRLVQAEP